MNIDSTVEGDIAIVFLEGKLLGETVSGILMDKMAEVLQAGCKLVAVDISKLTHSNSIGLGLMVSMSTRVSNQGGELVFFQASESVAKLIRLTRLDQVLKMAASKEEAIELLKS